MIRFFFAFLSFFLRIRPVRALKVSFVFVLLCWVIDLILTRVHDQRTMTTSEDRILRAKRKFELEEKVNRLEMRLQEFRWENDLKEEEEGKAKKGWKE